MSAPAPSIPLLLVSLCLLASSAEAWALETPASATPGDAPTSTLSERDMPELPTYQPTASAPRASVPAVFTWNLQPLFASDQAWEESLKALQGELPKLDLCEELSEPSRLLSCLETYFRVHDATNNVTLYANLQRAVAESDAAVAERSQKSLRLLSELMERNSVLRKGIMALTDKQLAKAYKKLPALEPYRAYIENLRRRKARVLPDQAERVLSLMGDNQWAEIDLNEIPSHSEESFNALRADIPWPSVQLADGSAIRVKLSNHGLLKRSRVRADREITTRALLATMRQYQNTFASTLAGQAAFDVSLARARGYSTAREAYLDKDALTPKVNDNLIKAVNERLAPLHRYMELRRKLLGVDKLRPWDLNVPITSAVDRPVPFAQARTEILSALEILGPDYNSVLAQALDPRNGWLDIYPSVGKQSGAFSASVFRAHPYVFMNYQDTPGDRSTLAHELGHALHSHLAARSQHYANFRYVPFIAEIASTTNEVLLSDLLISRASSDLEKAALISEHLDTIRNTIYRQTMFAEFELSVHSFAEEGKPITAELLDQTWLQLLQRYYGPAYEPSEDAGMEWAYVPHFYWKFYVSNYATGLSSAIALSELIRASEAGRDAYLGMLKGGCAQGPLELLKGAGVDLSEPEPIARALERFDRMVGELERISAPQGG